MLTTTKAPMSNAASPQAGIVLSSWSSDTYICPTAYRPLEGKRSAQLRIALLEGLIVYPTA